MKNRILFLLLALTALSLGAAQEGDAAAAERTRIITERAQADAAFRAQEKACYGKFAVNDCLNDAKARRREVLADLRRQEIALNDAERRRKAAERLKEIEANPAAGANPTGQQRTRQKAEAPPAEAASGPSRAARRQEQAQQKAAKQEAMRNAKAAEAEQKRRAHQERLAEAEERRAKAEKRLADRSKPPAKPLPVPP